MRDTIRLCQEGDSAAWQRLVEEFQGRVYAVCLYYLHNRDDAVDASQEVFVKVFGKLHEFNGHELNGHELNGEAEAFLAWLLSITRNRCIDRLRADNTRARHHGEYQLLSSEEDTALNPERALDREEQHGLLYRALASFSAVNRDILLLKDIQGLRLEEVAKILGLPIGTIKSRSNRARVKLGKLLAELKQ